MYEQIDGILAWPDLRSAGSAASRHSSWSPRRSKMLADAPFGAPTPSSAAHGGHGARKCLTKLTWSSLSGDFRGLGASKTLVFA